MEEMLNNLAECMAIKIRIINVYNKGWATDERRFTEHRPANKFDHELTGMTHALKAMGIPFEFEYDADVVEITAVIIMGIRYDI